MIECFGIGDRVAPQYAKTIRLCSILQRCVITPLFNISVKIEFSTQLVLHELHDKHTQNPFSVLYFYAKTLETTLMELERSQKNLNRENYSDFVTSMSGLCVLVIFDDNGTLNVIRPREP